jgi:hypothetical protein
MPPQSARQFVAEDDRPYLRRVRAKADRLLGALARCEDHNGELRHQGRNCPDGCEERSQDRTDGGDRHGNLDKRVAVLVLYDDALDVAFVDQFANFIDEVAANNMNFFNKSL